MKKPKIDEYMPLFYPVFFKAIEGYGDELGMKYLRAICHYWDKRCTGLVNDDLFLRNVCHCERDQWEQMKPIIFGVFFKKENGMWHQDFCRDVYNKAMEISERNRKRTDVARSHRWAK